MENVAIRGQKMLRSTLIVSFFSFLNFVVTFSTHMILAAHFGVKLEMDALFASLTVPTLFISFSLSVLNVVFVPVFVRYLRDSEKDSWIVAYNVALLFGFLLSAVVAVGVLFSRQIISVIVPGFDADKIGLAAHLLRVVFPALILIGLGDFLSGIHYAYEEFFLPFLSLFLRNLTVVLVVVSLGRSWGIDSYAYGMVLGALLYLLLLSHIVVKRGRHHFRWNPGHPGVRKTFKMIAPLVAGGLFFRTTELVDRYLLSALPEGTISYLGYSSRILTVVNTLLGRGISLTVYPKMSSFSASNDTAEFKRMFSLGLRMMLLVAVPAAFGLVVLREQLIAALFERGLFDRLATINVSRTLLCHVGAIVALPLSSVIVLAFYAIQDTKTVVKVGMVGAVINIVLDLLLVGRFRQLGIAFAYSTTTVVNMLVFLYILNRRLQGIHLGEIGASLSKMVAVSLIMVVSLILWRHVSGALGFAQQPSLALALSIGLGAAVYSMGSTLLQVNEMIVLKNFVSSRIRTLIPRKN